MATIAKKELIDRITKKTQCKNITAKEIVQQFLHEITTELAKNNRLEFRDFGVFEVKERAARTAQNPKTLEKIHVPARLSVKFKMGRIMKEKLNAQPDPS
ncbi:MAG: integration host factor subunit beta [Planctomycetes bacterium]|nr:integration host factor subunit beta [Planctomycetota bacterium]MBL7145543.1 integration host factor subunit beta [Phycisphaerae bacterium]